jgi:excisionase family DNA binding protein
MPGHSFPKSLLIDDAAMVLGVSRRTIYYRIREGRLETVRTPCGSQRVLTESILRLLRQRRLEDGGSADEGACA